MSFGSVDHLAVHRIRVQQNLSRGVNSPPLLVMRNVTFGESTYRVRLCD